LIDEKLGTDRMETLTREEAKKRLQSFKDLTHFTVELD